MSITIPQINTTANADTFGVAWQRINQIANAISTQVMTTDATSNGSITIGNGHISGYLSATLLATNTLRGGNVSTANVLTIVSNVAISNSVLYVGNSSVNTFINSTSIIANNASFQSLSVTNFSLSAIALGNSNINDVVSQTTGTSAQVIDSFLKSDYRGAEYVISVTDNVANGYQIAKLLVIHDGTNALITEYGTVSTNSSLGTFAAATNTTSVQLTFTPTSTNTSIRAIRNTIGA